MSTAALVLSVVAVTISLLGFGWTIGWSIYQHRRTTSPQIDVRGSFAVIALEAEPEHVYSIRAANVGLVPITITGCHAEVEGAADHLVWGRFYWQTPENLPRTVPPGDHWTGFIRANDFREAIANLAEGITPPWRVRVGVSDAASRTFRSPVVEVRAETD